MKLINRAFGSPSILIPLTVAAYIGTVLLTFSTAGRGIGAASVVPVSVIAFYYGARVGFLSGMAVLPTNWTLFAYLGRPETFLEFAFGSAVVGTITVALVGTAVGFVADLNKRLREEIAGRERAQSELNRLNGQLELQAERALQARSKFLTAISHKLRTPLNTSIGTSSLLLNLGLEDRHANHVKNILHSNEETVRIIDSILEYTKVQSGDIHANIVEFSLIDLFTDLANCFQIKSQTQGTKLSTVIHPSIASQRFSGARKHLEMILENLLSNALEATTLGEVKLEVTPTPAEGESRNQSAEMNIFQSLTFTVTDNGVGIPEAMMEQVFEAFGTAYETTTSAVNGASVGMALCHRLCQEMNGTIQVASEVGSGTAVTVQVPLAKATMCQKEVSASHRQYQATVPEQAGETMQILLAEDNQMNAKIAIKMLEKLGHSVTWVENGQQAVDAAHSDKYDLILMDIQMPVLDGLEATVSIRNSEDALRPNYIIALTADTMLESISKQKEHGFDGYIGKPVSLDKLRCSLPTNAAKPVL